MPGRGTYCFKCRAIWRLLSDERIYKQLKSLCTDEVITLYLSGIGIHPLKHTESGISLHNALLKLEKMLSPSYSKDIKNVRQRFLFDPEMWWNHKDVACLETIRKSVLQSRKLKLVYVTSSLGRNDLNIRVSFS